MNNITYGFNSIRVFLLDKIKMDIHMDPSKTYIQSLEQVRQGENDLFENFIENEGRCMELVGKDIATFLVHDITPNLELILNSITKLFFAHVDILDLELAD